MMRRMGAGAAIGDVSELAALAGVHVEPADVVPSPAGGAP